MPTPLDMLIGPALRHPQTPQQGEVPGSRKPQPSRMGTGTTVVAVATAAWLIRTVVRRARRVDGESLR